MDPSIKVALVSAIIIGLILVAIAARKLLRAAQDRDEAGPIIDDSTLRSEAGSDRSFAEEVKSVSEAIEELDGIQAVADLFGIGRGAVDMWGFRKAFPSDTYVVLQDALAERGCVAADYLFNVREAAE